MNKGGGGSSRNQFCNNEIRAGKGSEYVGIADSFNGPGQGALNFSDNKVIAGERSKQVGVTGVGNTTPTNKGGGCSSRNQFCNNEIRAESGSERCKQVGVTGVGNTRPTKAPAGAASYSLGEEEAERSQLKKDMINRKKK
ncbi:uncharacterized protein LOC117613449 isoform X2 [Prunus dulcis]|uniref:uncharacterized protein LOC117613449 isoform X2 n=1 Tax=Prunus dulcis TaxID=3755 RepID=UPI001481D1E6|nr:uncharacterized protein LOC117613449 isoform X2 [Prunus dulcis]